MQATMRRHSWIIRICSYFCGDGIRRNAAASGVEGYGSGEAVQAFSSAERGVTRVWGCDSMCHSRMVNHLDTRCATVMLFSKPAEHQIALGQDLWSRSYQEGLGDKIQYFYYVLQLMNCALSQP